MKKIIFAMFVAVATLACFSSCSDEEENIGLSDLLGQTFACSEDNAGNSFEYSITFNDDTEFSFTTSDSEKGTYKVSGNVVTLSFENGDVVTLEGDGHKKLISKSMNCTLKRK